MCHADLNCKVETDLCAQRTSSYQFILPSGPLCFHTPAQSTNMHQTRDYRCFLHSIDFSIHRGEQPFLLLLPNSALSAFS